MWSVHWSCSSPEDQESRLKEEEGEQERGELASEEGGRERGEEEEEVGGEKDWELVSQMEKSQSEESPVCNRYEGIYRISSFKPL